MIHMEVLSQANLIQSLKMSKFKIYKLVKKRQNNSEKKNKI